MTRIFTGIILLLLLSFVNAVSAQQKWVNADADFAPLPANVHVYKTTDSLDGKPNIAFYVEAGLKDKNCILQPIPLTNAGLHPNSFTKKITSP